VKSLEDLYHARKISLSTYQFVKKRLVDLESKVKTFSPESVTLNDLKEYVKHLEKFLTSLKRNSAVDDAKKDSREIIRALEVERQELMSMAKSREEMHEVPQTYEVNVALLDEVFDYLKNHRETSLMGIAKELTSLFQW
jgi:hypothetical protein